MKRTLWLLLLPLLISCTTVATPRTPVHITLVGADSMHWLARSIGDAYSQQRPNVTITVRPANSEAGLRAVREMSGTIGLVSRPIKPAELDQMHAVVVARDGVAVIVNRTNPINAIMSSQVAEVFAGQILTWPTGPSAGQNIVVISREDGSGTRDVFESMAMNRVRVTRSAIVMPSEAAVVDYVTNHREAIGYTSMAALTPEVRALTVNDVPLSRQSVESGQYPFVRELMFVVALSPDTETQDLVNFVIGGEGQRIIAQKYGRAP